MTDLQSIERRNKGQLGRVELTGDEAEELNKQFRATHETLERIRRLEEASALAALRCRNILVD